MGAVAGDQGELAIPVVPRYGSRTVACVLFDIQ